MFLNILYYNIDDKIIVVFLLIMFNIYILKHATHAEHTLNSPLISIIHCT